MKSAVYDSDDEPALVSPAAAAATRKNGSTTKSRLAIARYILVRARSVLLLLLCVSIAFYSWFIYFSDRLTEVYVSPILLNATSILWVTAHRASACANPRTCPLKCRGAADDESMFFAPSIYNLLSPHVNTKGELNQPKGHVLSLSQGEAVTFLDL